MKRILHEVPPRSMWASRILSEEAGDRIFKDGELTVEETKAGETLQLPITRQLAAMSERRRQGTDWVFPNGKVRSGHYEEMRHLYP